MAGGRRMRSWVKVRNREMGRGWGAMVRVCRLGHRGRAVPICMSSSA